MSLFIVSYMACLILLFKVIIPFLTDLDSPRRECWVCYDSERTDAGPMIFPCQCKGDLAAVHHDCLKRWLIEVKDTT